MNFYFFNQLRFSDLRQHYKIYYITYVTCDIKIQKTKQKKYQK